MSRLVLALILLVSPAHALAASASALRTALANAKSLVVEVRDERPDEAWHLDVEDLSRQLRAAGAAALITEAPLLGTLVHEQQSAKGNFPGPLPVLCEVTGADQVEAAREAGASGIALCWPSVLETEAVLAASDAAGMACVVVAGDPDIAELASTNGAVAISCAYEGAAPEHVGGDSATLGAWDGEDETLPELRGAGFGAMLLLDGCRGDLAANAAWCESRVKAFRSKASSQWGGSMFASTSSDVAPPSVRNPRAWAQSQRQAREMMHESAASRGLPPPKLKRNTVL